MSKGDSFRACYDYEFYQLLNEANLSIKSLSHKTYRLTYSTAFGEFVIISLADNFLTVKEGNTGDLYVEDTFQLTSTQNLHLKLLNKRYPIDTSGKNPRQNQYLSSMVKLYPKLLETSYYHYLYQKSHSLSKEIFSFKTKRIALTSEEFKALINEIDSSGFWKLPYKIECNVDIADGDGFGLDANTEKKYQTVSVQGCPDDTTRFTKTCQKIINYARLDKKINLIWNWDISIDTSAVTR